MSFLACSDPTPLNGQVSGITSFGHYTIGTNASFTCDPLYELIGTDFVSCLSNGAWNLPLPTCEPG